MMLQGGEVRLCSPGKKRKRNDPTERVCRHNGCDTILSRYNDTSWCSVHSVVIPGDPADIAALKREQNRVWLRGKG